ncbi:hypothetical protein ABFT23_09450 [Nocardioides sp. C4-1]|uniref:hypothetical protein n=1 Tax=Nocardioides sp. C4-1 TaxID=3151851 RepID=UPI003266E875
MTLLGLLLLGTALTDLAFSLRTSPRRAEAVGAAVVVAVGLAAGLTSFVEVGALVLVAAATIGWGEAVTYGFRTRCYRLPLLVLAGLGAASVLVSGASPEAGGLLGDWLAASDLPVLARLEPDRALLLGGVLVWQVSSGNVVVRLVLGATGTTHPGRTSAGSSALKGGRLLGPMERLFIVGFGVAGELTAASIVVAAKGLLRFPELQSARASPGGASTPTAAGIHEVTEYFLVGSFVSWSVSLLSLVLIAG